MTSTSTKDPLESTVVTSDKYKIHVKKWGPSGTGTKIIIKAHVIMIHGYLEHCGRYYELGQALAESGIALTMFDCRGHGKSEGQRAYCWSFTQYQRDLEAVLATLTDNRNNSSSSGDAATTTKPPIFLAGHSAGAVVALDYLYDKKKSATKAESIFQGVILLNPFLAPADRIPSWKIWASRILAWIAPVLPIAADEELTSAVLMHDEAKRKEHDEDVLNLQDATIGWGYGALKTQEKLLVTWKEKKIDLPVLYSFAGADKVADPQVNRKFGEDLVSPDKTIDHRRDKFHETLNEPDRQDLYALIGKWVLDHTEA